MSNLVVPTIFSIFGFWEEVVADMRFVQLFGIGCLQETCSIYTSTAGKFSFNYFLLVVTVFFYIDPFKTLVLSLTYLQYLFFTQVLKGTIDSLYFANVQV